MSEFRRRLEVFRIYQRCNKCNDGTLDACPKEEIHGSWAPYNNHGHFVGYTHKCDRCDHKEFFSKQYPCEEKIEVCPTNR